MKFQIKYRLMLWKSYLDKGRSLTSYMTEIVLLFGAWTIFTYKPLWLILAVFLSYAVFAFVLGYIWYEYGWQLAELEVQNQYNLFMKELRGKFNIRRKV